jgi:16S rRNA (cytosine1402-N4)-methyltransferase
MESIHETVLLVEAVAGLNIAEDGIYVDCTFGRGGHSRAILEQLGPSGHLLALDKDLDAVNSENARALQEDPRFELEHGSYTTLADQIEKRGWSGKVSGVLMDLGVSSPQLDEADRGFSFMRNGPLDMRMNRTTGETAAEWLATVEEEVLRQVIRQYGEERFAKRIANAIVLAREEQPIETTHQLVDIVVEAIPVKEKGKHPATRTFQAIRIHLNGELSELTDLLSQAVSVLGKGGRLVVISFHSLEDRISKRFIRNESKGGDFPKGLPVRASEFDPALRKRGGAIKASAEEIDRNPRSRSAILRIAEKMK